MNTDHQGGRVASTEEIDPVLEMYFPRGVAGAVPESCAKAEEELARMFDGRVKVEGECTWDSTRPLGDKLRCNIKLTFGAEAAR